MRLKQKKLIKGFKNSLLLCLMATALADTPAQACDCAKISSVKGNMHALQTMAETYFEVNGVFPTSVRTLERHAKTYQPPYWKNFSNPLTGRQSGEGDSWGDYRHYQALFENQHQPVMGLTLNFGQRDRSAWRGMVLYQQVSPTNYRIYGTRYYGELITERGQVFELNHGY